MLNERIKEVALACGFKTKPQPNGVDDLHPYVYQFAQELILEAKVSAYTDAIAVLAEQQHNNVILLARLRDNRVVKED